MVVLSSTLALFFFVISAAGGAFASPSPSSGEAFLDLGARALARGDLVRGKALLSAMPKDVATLYKLAWIARLHGVSDVNRPQEVVAPDLENKLAWKPSLEIWRDEWASYDQKPALTKSNEPFFADPREEEVIRSILKSKERGNSPYIEKAALACLYNQWQNGRTSELEPLFSDGCQWEAKKLLEDKVSDALQPWGDKCGACTGLFCSVARLKLADQKTKEGDYKEALDLYLDVSREFVEVPSEIHYRIAATQILAQKPIENELRAANPLFGAEKNKVSEVQIETVRSHLCEELSGLSPLSLGRLFKRVYTKRSWVREARSWILSCGPSHSSRISRIVDDKSLSPIEKQSLIAAVKVKKKKLGLKRELSNKEKELTGVLPGGLATRARTLNGVLHVPVLFPFPDVSWPRAPYRFMSDFYERVSKNEDRT